MMSTETHLGVSGAPAREVAALIADEAGVDLAPESVTPSGTHWYVAAEGWSASIAAYVPSWRLPGDADVIVDVDYPAESITPLHALTERLYRRIVTSTAWDVSAESEVEGFPARSRTRAAA